MRLITADPGLEGAIVFCDVRKIDSDGYVIENVRIHDMPTTKGVDEKNLPDPVAIAELIESEGGFDAALIEKVGPRPGRLRATEWRLAMGYGVLLACVSQKTEHDTIHLIDPSTWKRRMGVTRDKQTSVEEAKKLGSKNGISFLKSRDGRAEAYLLAHYYARHVMMKR